MFSEHSENSNIFIEQNIIFVLILRTLRKDNIPMFVHNIERTLLERSENVPC